MEIQELYLKHYGKFENHRILLKPGINIIYGGNEAGKTTIHSFVQAMLFGLNRGRGRAAKTDEYQIRQPWDCPGAFLGSMKVRENGEVYRIDRCFDRSARPLTVTCETRGQEFDQPERAMAGLLGGISETAFVNTVFVPQAQAETDEALAQELQRYMVNSNSTLDAQLDLSQALQDLRKKKKLFEQKKKKEDELMEARIEKKQANAEMIRNELEILRRQAGISAAQYGSGRENGKYAAANAKRAGRRLQAEEEWRDEYSQESGKYPDGYPEEDEWTEDSVGKGKTVLEILLLLAGILALAGAFLLTDWKVRAFLGVFGAVFLALILPVHFLFRGHSEEDGLEEEISQSSAQNKYLLEEIRNREEIYGKLQDELEELYHSHVRLDGIDTEIAALTLAIDRICELSSGIYAKSGGELAKRASEILSELTDGAYDRILLDETSSVRVYTPSRVLGLHQVSGGTMQQIYFALRMAAGELLCEGRKLPIILDETFAMYDDTRLEAALRWLKKSGRQVLLFTCQKREREMLERIS